MLWFGLMLVDEIVYRWYWANVEISSPNRQRIHPCILYTNVQYINDNGIGKFIDWCQENGYDTDMIIEEFDKIFPISTTGKQKQIEIFEIVKHCWENERAFIYSINIISKTKTD
eukprot:75174_1